MNDDLLHKFNEVEKYHWWWLGRQELVKNLLLPEKPKKVLDIGCGTGETISFLKTILPKTKFVGIDTSLDAIRFTKDRGHTVKKGNATRLPFDSNTFDAVLLLDVIEHIKNDILVIKEAKRVLRPGGIIVLTAPALQFIWSNHDSGQGHQRRYTRRRLMMLANQHGLSVPFISYFNFLLSPMIIFLRLISRLPLFSYFGKFDSKLNYRIANKKLANAFLKTIFVSEVKMLKLIRYPIGISIAVKMQKV